MSRGGRRTGTPGASYPQRSDLQLNRQPAQAPTGMPYGEHQQSIQSQQAVPLPNAAPSATPGQFGPLDQPTGRPNEPVTTGLPLGAGAGPEALNMAGTQDDFSSQIRALYTKYPSNDLLRLIEAIDNEG